jgi:hypothetical protein
MSSLSYFIVVWMGSKRVLGKKIKPLLCSYLWSRSENTTRARVNWGDYIMPKKVGGLSLTLPEDAMKALMSKWINQALLPSKSNLQIILRYHIMHLQPSYHGPWGPSSLWPFSSSFSTKGGSKVWHLITQSWKVWQARLHTFLHQL